ncbi:hypothetical protein J2W42_005508 [Rhizobium tibeticum]|uniref:hypothetical protein n=1 Tax=Rhizobium tibeticum TaxID=501024 RepID=UPI0027829FE5|nr:hypothetical protein [Rhizobium tibeticum]MDP9812638.1 hypothetical protein [Rhizobium tibeticum]
MRSFRWIMLTVAVIIFDAAASDASAWGKAVAIPLVEGFAALWRGEYQAAANRLHGARYIANAFGGSHAQRDIIDWTLAEAIANERLALKPHSFVNRSFLSRAGAVALAGLRDA